MGRNPTGADTFLTIGAGRAAHDRRQFVGARARWWTCWKAGWRKRKWSWASPISPACPVAPACPASTVALSGSSSRAPRRSRRRPGSSSSGSWSPNSRPSGTPAAASCPSTSRRLSCRAAKEIEAKYPQFKIAAELYLAASASPAPRALSSAPVRRQPMIIRRAIEEMLVGDKDPIDSHQRRRRGGERAHRGLQPAYRVAFDRLLRFDAHRWQPEGRWIWRPRPSLRSFAALPFTAPDYQQDRNLHVYFRRAVHLPDVPRAPPPTSPPMAATSST